MIGLFGGSLKDGLFTPNNEEVKIANRLGLNLSDLTNFFNGKKPPKNSLVSISIDEFIKQNNKRIGKKMGVKTPKNGGALVEKSNTGEVFVMVENISDMLISSPVTSFDLQIVNQSPENNSEEFGFETINAIKEGKVPDTTKPNNKKAAMLVIAVIVILILGYFVGKKVVN